MTTTIGRPVAAGDHEAAAKAFVEAWENHLLSLCARDGADIQRALFVDRNRLVQELRELLREERHRGYEDAHREVKEQLEAFIRERI